MSLLVGSKVGILVDGRVVGLFIGSRVGRLVKDRETGNFIGELAVVGARRKR